MTKAPAARKPEESGAPDLSFEQCEQLALVDYDLPEYPKLSNGEIGALCGESLEAYAYGERTRYDTSGKKWCFRRGHANDQFYLEIACSVGPVVLCDVTLPLDRIAGKEGEDALIDLVTGLCGQTVEVANACRARQQAMKPEEG